MSLMPLLSAYWSQVVEKGDKKRISSQSPTPGVTTASDIQYVDDGKWQHRLDVYRPDNMTSPLPVIIDIHGGGWMYGTKEINKYYNLVLASRGYVVFSINYHLMPESNIKTQLQDCMLGFKWIKENAEKYNADLSMLFVTGDSAGGFLAAYSAMLNNSEKLRNVFDTVSPELQIKALGLTSPVCYMNTKNIVGLYTKVLIDDDRDNASYIDYVNLDDALKHSTLPPTYLVTSAGDMPAKNATFKAYEDLEDNGVACKLRYIPDKKLLHVFSVIDPYSADGVYIIDDMLKFFENHK